MSEQRGPLPIGWREWLSFPALAIPAIKAKVDTGARTSALHAFRVTPYEQEGREMVCFQIHPLQRRADVELECHAQVVDRRVVSDSGGHREYRYVIETPVRIGADTFPIEVTLTDRDTMLFRMLLGRTALEGRYAVDVARSFTSGPRHYHYPGE